MVTVFFLNDAVQFASHNWPIDNREADLSFGNTLTSLAAFGSPGMFR